MNAHSAAAHPKCAATPTTIERRQPVCTMDIHKGIDKQNERTRNNKHTTNTCKMRLAAYLLLPAAWRLELREPGPYSKPGLTTPDHDERGQDEELVKGMSVSTRMPPAT